MVVEIRSPFASLVPANARRPQTLIARTDELSEQIRRKYVNADSFKSIRLWLSHHFLDYRHLRQFSASGFCLIGCSQNALLIPRFIEGTDIVGNRSTEIFVTNEALVLAAANRILGIMTNSVLARGQCHLVLSGGSTPGNVFKRLASDDNKSRVDWNSVFFYWGDERTVPPDHVDSNYKTAYEPMLSFIPAPDGNILRMRGELEPETAAEEYQKKLLDRFSNSLPRFDLIMLGMGNDGHTASLFPGTTAVEEKKRLVAPVFVDRLNTWRITLTPHLINNARSILFLVSGTSKASMVRQVLTSTPDKSLPSTLIAPANGELIWMLDKDAASLL
jgi:6-phosphogluconolactonase